MGGLTHIAARIFFASIALALASVAPVAFAGNCDYAWQRDSAGRLCGARAANVRAGGRLGGGGKAATLSADETSGGWLAIDGDTIKRGAARVRFCAVNAPERNEPGGTAATAALRRLLANSGGEVRVIPTGKESYGRTVARVIIGGVDAQFFLLASGHARLDSRYVNACKPAGLTAATLRRAALFRLLRKIK